MPEFAAGVKEEQSLRSAGFTDSEIESWRDKTVQQLGSAGFSSKEIGAHFGEKNPDMTPLKNYFQQGLHGPNPAPPTDVAEAQPAKTFLEALDAGWQMSVSGLIARQKNPETVLPENAPMYYRIASQVSTLAGDLPFMAVGAAGGGVAGAAAGGAAGTATLPVVGTVGGAATGGTVGAGAGAMGLPTALRRILMDHYEKGDIQDFSDFWERASGTFLETFKSGLVGGLTAGAGSAVKVSMAATPAAIRGASVASAEVATMVTAGKALEGEVPKAQDFLDAAVVVAGLHGATHVASRLRSKYVETGARPEALAQEAASNPALKEELLAKDPIPPEEMAKAREAIRQEGDTSGEPRLVAERLPEAPRSEQLPKDSPILNRIGTPEQRRASVSWDEFYTMAVDDLHPIKQFRDHLTLGQAIEPKNDPYVLARLNRGVYGKADQFLELSPFKFETLENTGKSFKEIMKPVKGDLDGFREYAISARALELHGRGIETGVPMEAAKAAVEAGRGKYEGTFREMQEFQTHVLTYLKDSGLLSKEAYEKTLEANRDYVPFHRLMEDEVVAGGGRGLKVRNPVKAIEGSERQLIDPIESIIKNTYTFITLAERNRVLTKIVELAEGTEAGQALIEKVPTPQRPVEVSKAEIADFFKEQGIKATPEEMTVFRPQLMNLAKDEIAVYRSGKREVYRVSENLAEAIKGLDKESIGLVTKLLSVPAKTLRAGTTLAPDFFVRNVLRDQIGALNLSKSGYIPFVDALRGMGSLFKKDKAYQGWLKSGGANAAMVAIDRAYIQENVFKLSEETGLMSRVRNVAKSPLELLRVTSELLEDSTRLGEFKKATGGDTSANSLYHGAMNSREVTLDFARVGAKTRAMNLITAFWNAQIQGLDRTARAFKDDPTGMFTKTTASVTVPSLLLWWANKDDERYKELPRWQKDLFWIIPTDKWSVAAEGEFESYPEHMKRTVEGRQEVNKGTVWRIPKPFELGLIFGSLPERALEAFVQKNPRAFEDFADSMSQAFTPGYIPTFALPVIEHFANRSTFTGKRIVPGALEGLLPEYQYSEYTSESAKLLGKFVAALPPQDNRFNSFASPAVIENYIRAWSGNLGKYALQMADIALEKTGVAPPAPLRPAPALADMPVIKAFAIRYPTSSTQSIEDFFDRYAKSEKVLNTIKHLARSGDAKAAEKELQLEKNQPFLQQLGGIKAAMENQMQFMRLVEKNPAIKPEEKRQIIDGIYYQMMGQAKMGNDIFIAIDSVERGEGISRR